MKVRYTVNHYAANDAGEVEWTPVHGQEFGTLGAAMQKLNDLKAARPSKNFALKQHITIDIITL